MKHFIEAPLQELFDAIAQAQTEDELRESIVAKVGAYFAAKRWGLYFTNEFLEIDDNTPAMMKRALSLDDNPVLRYLVQRHAAIHDEAILPRGVWRRICPRADHGHVMVGPTICNGQLIGGIAVTRHRDDPAFNTENLADLSALCLHVSTRLSTLRSQSVATTLKCVREASPKVNRLTPRETEIAELVARGLTNREIGQTIWITENSVKQALKRMFRKLEVSSRAQMVAELSSSIPKPAARAQKRAEI